MTARKSLLVVALLVFAGMAGTAARSHFQGRRHTQPAFTLISRVTHFNPNNPSQQLHGDETRYAFSDGSYRVVYKGEQGASQEYFFKRGAGFFEVNLKQRQLVRNPKMSPDAGARRPAAAEELLADRQLLRTENVLGLTAYVMRVTDESTGAPTTDLYFAVETGNAPLKTIDYDGKGRVVAIAEPVNIIFGEPAPSLLDAPDYPVVEGESK